MRLLSATSRFALIIVAALSSGCSTHTVGLAYRPAVAPTPAASKPSVTVSVGDFTDNRHEPSHWIGAIRGGYGNALKTLETDKPVSELVKEAFKQALVARSIYSDAGQVVLSGWIDKLDGDQYARKEATVQLRVIVADRQARRELLNRPASANKIEGSAMTIRSGVFGSVEELQSLIERVLSQTVDEFVDSSAFRDLLQTASPQPQPSGSSFRTALRVGMPLIELTSIAPRPASAVDRLGQNGVVVGKTFTYQSEGETIVVTVENGVVTSVIFK